MPKILIDENLSPSLETMAHDRGFECSHVNHLGKTGQKDWGLCVNAPRGLNLASQKQLFTLILDDLEKGGDLTNQVMDVHLDKMGTMEIRLRFVARFSLSAFAAN